MAVSLIKDPDARNDPPRPLMEHLFALRDMLVFMAASWAVAFLVAVAFAPRIMTWLESPLAPYIVRDGADPQSGNVDAANVPAPPATADGGSVCVELGSADGEPRWRIRVEGLDVTSGVMTTITIGAWAGTALGFPFLAFALLRFLFPALTRREKFVIMSILVVGTALFAVGVGLAYSQTLPLIVETLLSINDWLGLTVETLRIDGYVPLILKTVIAFGLVFQIPLILFMLGWFGIVSSAGLREKRRWAIVAAFVIGMLLTPPDPMSQIVMAVPLCVMYEMSVWAVWLKERLSSAA